MQWITDYENAFAELKQLNCTNWNDDAARKRRILKNVSTSKGMQDYIFQHITKNMTSSEVLAHLKSQTIQSNKASENVAARNARLGLSLVRMFLRVLTMTTWHSE